MEFFRVHLLLQTQIMKYGMQEVVVNYYSNEKLPFFLSKAYCSSLFYMYVPLHKISVINHLQISVALKPYIQTPIEKWNYEIIINDNFDVIHYTNFLYDILWINFYNSDFEKHCKSNFCTSQNSWEIKIRHKWKGIWFRIYH